jgi:tRNA G18 (ribose-2'-O)-methylase SpoU
MLVPLTKIDDPRLSDYREIKDKPLLDRGLFLAEGENVVLRLLRAAATGDFRVRSVLLADKRVPDIAPHVPPSVPVYSLPGEAISRLLGFDFHSGVIACGLVPASPPLDQVIPPTGPARLVVLPEISSAENMGTLIRLAAGLGAHAIVAGERCTHPFLRRTVRVSMGTVFALPIVRSTNLLADLARLREHHRITTLGTVLPPPEAEPLGANPTPDRLAVLFGSEAQGLSEEEIAACDRLVTIPMSLGVDSLNVAISAAITLWELFGTPKSARTSPE